MHRPLIAYFTLLFLTAVLAGGCSTLRTTDPSRTATEQYLLNEASKISIDQLTVAPLRDRLVYVDSSFLIGTESPSDEKLFVVGELRSKLLEAGCRLTGDRVSAEAIVEVRAVGIGIDKLETIYGLPSFVIPGGAGTTTPLATPELAFIKRLRQEGFSSVAYVAYWNPKPDEAGGKGTTVGGDIITSSGPYLGRTSREDFWILGFGPRTVGNIPPATTK